MHRERGIDPHIRADVDYGHPLAAAPREERQFTALKNT
jgi:hypothetical protein